MELLNMFSDLAPISNSGYRKQLYTDPGILQGQEFLRNENKIKRLVERNLDLNLVSDVNGSESTIIHSVENFEPSEDNTLADTDADTYANTDTHTHNNYNNKKDYNNFEEGLSLQKSKKKVKKETEEEKETEKEKEKEERINNENELKQTIHSFVSCSIGEVVSKKTGKCVKSGEEGFETIIKEGFREGLTIDDEYNNLKNNYNTVLTAYNTLIRDFQTKYNTSGGLQTTSSDPNAASTRTQVFTQLKNLSTQLNTISTQLLNSVKTNTTKDFASYNAMQNEIDNVQITIKNLYRTMQENKGKTPDIETSLAKENETKLLTKQRYYMYIIWFIIMVVILYITITNLVNAESSFTVLLICLIVLVCLFLFFIYNKWNGEWYDFKYKLKNFNLGIPDIPKLDFNPLVRIRYTS